MKKYVFVILLIIVTVRTNAQVSANATRPSASDNAYLTSKGYTELEMGFSSVTDFWSVPTFLKFSPSERIELGVILSGILNHSSVEKNTEIGDPGVQIKYQFMNNKTSAFAAVARTDFLSSTNPKYTAYLTGSFQSALFQIDATLGTEFIDNGSNNYNNGILYALALTPKFDSKMGAFVEIFGESINNSTPLSFDFGVAYAVSPVLILDSSYTFGLNNYAQDWQFQIGFTATLFKLM